MGVINIEASPKTPKVHFDHHTGILELSGRSIPENSTEFYRPVYEWLDEYTKKPNPTTIFKFKLEYFNTSSSKCILDIYRKLEKLHQMSHNIQVIWYFEEDDEDMQEAGEDYQRIVNVPIKLEVLKEAE